METAITHHQIVVLSAWRVTVLLLEGCEVSCSLMSTYLLFSKPRCCSCVYFSKPRGCYFIFPKPRDCSMYVWKTRGCYFIFPKPRDCSMYVWKTRGCYFIFLSLETVVCMFGRQEAVNFIF